MLHFWIGGVWCVMPHYVAARFFINLFFHTASSGKMTRLQEEVWTAEAEARTDSVLRAARCHPRRRVPRQPGWGEEACGGGGGDGGHLFASPCSIPLSFIHGSILSLPFLFLLSSILRQPSSPCLPPRLSGLPFIHNSNQWKLLSCRLGGEGGPRVEIRVSFIIPYKPPSQLPGTNSKGNRMANSPAHLHYHH